MNKEILNITPTKSNVNYINSLENILINIKDVEGDILELGVFKGTNSIIFGKLIKKHNLKKKYIGIDTFKGYTIGDLEDSKKFVSQKNHNGLSQNQNSGRWNWSLEKVEGTIRDYNIDDVCEIYEGDIKDVVPNLDLKKISLLYVDCNVYTPAIFSMEKLYENMDNNSIICIDEHIVGGETKALKDFSEKYNQKIIETGAKYPHGPPMYIVINKE